MKDGKHGGLWSRSQWKPHNRDGGELPARVVVPGAHTGLRQGLTLMALPQVASASHVTAAPLVPSHSTVMKTVSVGVSPASPDPNVTVVHKDFSTFKREGAHLVNAVMWGTTVMLALDSVSVLQTLSVRGANAVLPTTGAMTS